MLSRIAWAIGLAILTLLPTQLCVAAEEEPIVWVSDNHSLLGVKRVALYSALPTADGSEAVRTATDLIRNALQNAGVTVANIKDEQRSRDIGLQIQVVHYTPGNVGGRWIGLGGGAAICIIRAFILDGSTGAQIGDVVVAEQVGSGGLFTIGAEKHVLRAAAHKTAEELARLFGVELLQEEEAQQ